MYCDVCYNAPREGVVFLMTEERMLTLAEAAAELGVGISSLHRYIRKYGLQTYRKIGDKRGYLRMVDVEHLKGFTPKEERGPTRPLST